MSFLPDYPFYILTDVSCSRGRPTLRVVEELLGAGVKILQYREKHLSKQHMLEECRSIRSMTREAACCFIVNDNVDIALACDADGVHLGQDDLPLGVARKLLGTEKLIGVSVHTLQEMNAALTGGADYLGVGAVFMTNTKQDAVYVGLDFLDQVMKLSTVPIVAIGGINVSTIGQLVRRHVRYFALISSVLSADSISAQVRLLEKTLMKEMRHV